MNKLAVALITDANYVMQISVVISSIIANAKNTQYDIFVLGSNLPDKDINILLSMSTDNVKVNIVDVGNKFRNITNKQKWSNTVFIKFDIPYLIPQYDKVLYLDGDMVVNQDLTELAELDLKDYYAAVVPDVTQVLQNELYPNIDNYFCAGMMLLNTKKIRETFSFEFLLNYYYENQEICYSLEQDVFNFLFGHNILHLPIKYQYIVLYDFYLKNNLKKFYEIKYSRELNSDNIAIFHYVSLNPWKFFNTPYVKLWDKYFKLSPYYKKLNRKFYNPFCNLYRRIRYNIRFKKFKNKRFFNYFNKSKSYWR